MLPLACGPDRVSVAAEWGPKGVTTAEQVPFRLICVRRESKLANPRTHAPPAPCSCPGRCADGPLRQPAIPNLGGCGFDARGGGGRGRGRGAGQRHRSLPLEPFADGQVLFIAPTWKQGGAGPAPEGGTGGRCPGHYPHLPPGGRGRLPGADSSGWGARAAPAGGAGAGAARRGRGRRCGRRAGLGREALQKFLGRERGSWVQLFLVCQAGPAASSRGGRLFHRPREVEGCLAGGGRRDADAGKRPLGAELRSAWAARARERGPGPGLWRTVASPGPDSLTAKAAAAGELPGSAGSRRGADGSGDWAARVGGGGAIPGGRWQRSDFGSRDSRRCRATPLVALLRRTCLRGTGVVFKSLEKATSSNLTEPQSATKGGRARASCGRSRGRAAAGTRVGPPAPPRA